MKKFILFISIILLSTVSYTQVSFHISKESFTRPDTVIFLNTTQNTSSLQWLFPGGIASSLNDNEVTVVYENPGAYSVSLKVEDSNAKLDSLEIANYFTAPGIITNDIVFCKPETLIVEAVGGVDYTWNNSGSGPFSTYTNYSPQSGYYVVTIAKDLSYITSMKDSIKVTVASDPGLVGNQDISYCIGDSVRLEYGSELKSYTLTKLVFNGLDSYLPDLNSTKKYSKSNPFYFKSSERYNVDYVDSLNCPWTYQGTYFIGSNAITRPQFSLSDQTICKGNTTNITTSPNLSDNPIEWYKNGQMIGTGSTLYDIADTGKYMAIAYDFTQTCSNKDSAIISFTPANPESLTSINYLPGIGYVSTYTRIFDNQSYVLYNNKGIRVDSVSDISRYSYGKIPMIIDTNSYNDTLKLNLKSYNYCGISAASKTYSPVWLTAEPEINSGGMALNWSKYTVKNVSSYYIFKGTNPENMQLLDVVAASGMLSYTDTIPVKGAMYAIGVKDDDNVGSFYKDMLLNWQAGYLTSNISPMPINYNRIGVFAFLQNDKAGSDVYLQAIAPKADSIKWELAGISNTIYNTGFKTSNYYDTEGLFDVKVKTFTKNKVDSLVLRYFIKIGNPIYFAIDTIYKSIGNDTLSIDIAKTIKNAVSVLSTAKVLWSVTQRQDSLVKIEKAITYLPNNETRDSLLVWINPKIGDTILTIKLYGDYFNSYYQTGFLTIIVSGKTNEKPLLIDSIPEQIASIGKNFSPISLPSYIRDDYSQFQKLKFTSSINPYFIFTVKDGYLYADQKDGSFTGTTEMTLRVIDESGLENNFVIQYTQPYLVNVPISKPTASFFSNKLIIVPQSSVRFTTQLSSADSIGWNFNGAVQSSGTVVNPTVTFNKAGKYTITLTAKNNLGKIDVIKQNYIIVTALSPQDTLICKGDSVVISVLGAGFTSYLWNTNQTTASIKVAPTKTTNYKVTMFKGLSKIIDSVTIQIPLQPELGNDTTFCEGGKMRLTPGTFNKYYWNGSTTNGLSYYDATTFGKIKVRTIDSKGCISSDSITIGALYPKPTVNLGKDSIFCWKKKITIDAQNTGAKFKWSSNQVTQTIVVDTTGQYIVTVTDLKTCSNSDTISIKVIVPIIPTLGLVTNSQLGKNLIAWEPQSNKGITLYHVWKESSVAGKFDIIDTLYINDITISIDQKSDPKIKSDNYALSTVDSACGNESYLSPIHSSIHLTCVFYQKENTVVAKWNNYIGLTVSKYIIYRAEKGKPLVAYDTIDAVKGLAKMEYTDTNPIGLNSYYQVRFNLNGKLTPSRLKSDSGPFSQSLSNMAESELTEEAIVLASDITISPNPAKSKTDVSIATQKDLTVTVIDLFGRELQKKNGTGKVTIDCSSLNSGLYILKIESENKVKSHSLIVE
jgi:PKD repeat protein